MREKIIRYLLKKLKKRHVFITIENFLEDGSVDVTVMRNISDKNLTTFLSDIVYNLRKEDLQKNGK